MEKSIKRYFPVFLGPTFLAFLIGFIVPFLQLRPGLPGRGLCPRLLVYRPVHRDDAGAD